MENNKENDSLEQLLNDYVRHSAEERLRAELAASYPRLRRRWKMQVGSVLTVALLVITIGSAVAMPAPDYSYLRGTNATTPRLAITDINATLKAL